MEDESSESINRRRWCYRRRKRWIRHREIV